MQSLGESGSIVIVCPENSAVPKFVSLIDRLPVQLRQELVLVGGLSVTCRLQFAFRVTDDIDSVYFNDSENELASVLANRFNTILHGHQVDLGGGIHLDVIETGNFDPDDLPDDTVDRLFVEAHRWAYDTADLEYIVAVHPETAAVHAATAIQVASAAALVVMKLGTLDEPTKRPPEKKASDAADIYRLLDQLNATGKISGEVSDATGDIPDLTAANLQRHFLDRADVTAGRISAHIPLEIPIQPNDLRRVATRFLH